MTKVFKQSSYEHISSFKPKFLQRVDNVLHHSKAVTFSSNVVPDTDKGTLSTSLIYSQGSDIYELGCEFPLGGEKNKEPKPDSEYGDAFAKVEDKKFSPKWVYSCLLYTSRCV